MRLSLLTFIFALPLLMSCSQHESKVLKPGEIFRRQACGNYPLKDIHGIKRDRRMERIRKQGCRDNTADCGRSTIYLHF